MRALIYRILKGIFVDVLQDEQVATLGIKWFVNTMITNAKDPTFKDTYVKVLWCTVSKNHFKSALTDNLMDGQFVSGIANLIQALTGEDFLMELLKNELRDTLADQDIHRALMK